MKKMNSGIACCMAVMVILLISCDTSFYPTLSRSNADPVAANITVDSFKYIDGIPLRWESDPLADSFVVYRESVDTKEVSVVYGGTEVQFKDTGAIPGAIYKYSLAKVRGDKEFARGAEAVGAFSPAFTKDPNGANDAKEKALNLWTDQMKDQISFYASRSIVLEDTDWFFVDVPARMQVKCTFSYDDIAQDGKLSYQIENSDTQVVTNAGTIVLANSTLVAKRMYFKIAAANGSAIATLSPKINIFYSLIIKEIQIFNP